MWHGTENFKQHDNGGSSAGDQKSESSELPHTGEKGAVSNQLGTAALCFWGNTEFVAPRVGVDPPRSPERRRDVAGRHP